MSVSEDEEVELVVEKPASGGRMIARHQGQIVLVRGAIPGERVLARIERAEKQLAYAVTREVLEPSADRRPYAGDPLCGGALYSHVSYARQLTIKSDVIRDAFARLARYPIDHPIDVAASPEEGYRMRARFHVHGARAGFYREGTHELCDPASTGQLRPETIAAAAAVAGTLHESAPGAAVSISIAENIPGTERAAHVDVAPGSEMTDAILAGAVAAGNLHGISAHDMRTGRPVSAGLPVVSDALSDLTSGRASGGSLRRQAASFFQGNRYLLPLLVTAVADATPDGGEVLDLYAGVGLFSIALAAMGRREVTAVEGDRSSGADLRENARSHAPRLAARIARVEDYLGSRKSHAPATVIIDPPRTGLSKEAARLLARMAPGRLVYVSCDPPTLARDARRLLDASYRLEAMRAFDLFPNTPHVEVLAVFVRVGE
jgi:23S rRNA (uracil1939-C5)-methyltransferase